MTLREEVEEFVKDLMASGRPRATVKSYSIFLNYFADWVEKNGVNYLEAAGKDFRRYRNHLVAEKKFSPNTVNMCIYAVKLLYDFLVDEGVLPGNPVVTRRLTVRAGESLPKFLTDAELRKIFDSDTYRNAPYRAQLAIKTMLVSGLRIGEVCSLTSEDVVDRDGIVFLRVRAENAKRKKGRYVPVLSEEVGKELIACRDGMEISTNSKNKDKLFGMGTARLANYCWDIKQETGIDFHAHRLRHTLATTLLNKGVRIDVIQEILGHADISTTRRYAKTLPNEFFRLVERLKGDDPFGDCLSYA